MFFSVKLPIKIAGKVYMPCICYNLQRYMELTVKELEEQGKAVIHEKMVFFQNGKIVEKPTVKQLEFVFEKPVKEKKHKKEEKEKLKEIMPDETEGF